MYAVENMNRAIEAKGRRPPRQDGYGKACVTYDGSGKGDIGIPMARGWSAATRLGVGGADV
jgi:hypothetical protein